MDLGLKGKKAIVTGATKGIGRRIVNLLADEGVNVAICARDEGEVKDAVEALEKKGVKATGKAVNVKKKEDYEAWLTAAAEDLGGCDIFVPNVSAGGGMDSEKNWWNNFEVDVLGTVRGVETLMPFLKKSGSASVVLISSTNALEFFMGPMAYNAMKAALINYAKQLSETVAKKGIRVNTVSPGPVYFEGGAWEMIKGAMPAIYEDAIAKMPRGSMCSPEEIANVVAFLASPASSAMTGANVVADAGFTKGVRY